MNFSDAFQQTKHLVAFSPDSQYVASCCQYRLVVRDCQTLQIVNLHTCLDQVQALSWSPDSLFIMCGMFKRGVVQVGTMIEWNIIKINKKIVALKYPVPVRHVSNSGLVNRTAPVDV